MDFRPTPQQEAVQLAARELSQSCLAPRAREVDAGGGFPHANLKDLADAGFLALPIPVSQGGRWVDHVAYTLALLEMAQGCGSTALIYTMHAAACFQLLCDGSAAQRAEVFRSVLSGHNLLSVAYSDSASSGPGAVGVVAAPTEHGYRLSGRKSFVTSAGAADLIFVTARLEERGDGEGTGAIFLVPGAHPALHIAPNWDGMGMRATCSHDLEFQGMDLPHSARLGAPSEPTPGYNPLTVFALGLAAASLGAGQAAFDAVVNYCRTRTAPLSQHRRVMLGEMSATLVAARLRLLHAAWVCDTRPEAILIPLNEAKYLCNTIASEVANQAMLVWGGQGYLRRHPLERHLRDARAGALMINNSEACREIVADQLLAIRE